MTTIIPKSTLSNMNIMRQPFRYRQSNVVYYLIGINILIYLGVYLFRTLPVIQYFAMSPVAVIYLNRYWQFLTYMFIHDPRTINHILFNMFALFIFGRQVEWKMGSREFLLYYLLTGFLAGVFSFFIYLLTNQVWISLMGASGAIFAVQLAYAAFFPNSVIYIWGILPLRAPVLVLGFAGLEVFFLLTRSGGNVAHITHLGGFAFGWLYFQVRFGLNPWYEMRR